MNRLITSTAIPARELKIEALASMSASFERLCLAAGYWLRVLPFLAREEQRAEQGFDVSQCQ
jgi:hypothetical protein